MRSMMPNPLPILVAACGNLMAGDDAFGPLVAAALRARAPHDIEVVDLGLRPAGLLDHLAGRRALIVVDAAEAGPDFAAGSLIDMDFFAEGRPPLLHDAPLSSHGLSIPHELELAGRLELLPSRVQLVAAAVIDTTIGRSPSTAVSELVQPAVGCILQLSGQFLRGLPETTHA